MKETSDFPFETGEDGAGGGSGWMLLETKLPLRPERAPDPKSNGSGWSISLDRSTQKRLISNQRSPFPARMTCSRVQTCVLYLPDLVFFGVCGGRVFRINASAGFLL